LDPPLPGFGKGNWESRIRKYVTAHENYQDMEAWKGQENADIMYDDVRGEFTKLLIDNGYLDRKVWANATPPTYWLEVKSTIGECDGTFFVGPTQYEEVCDKAI
jgi:hypothetical protein